VLPQSAIKHERDVGFKRLEGHGVLGKGKARGMATTEAGKTAMDPLLAVAAEVSCRLIALLWDIERASAGGWSTSRRRNAKGIGCLGLGGLLLHAHFTNWAGGSGEVEG